MSATSQPRSGLDRVIEDPSLIDSQRPALLTNFAAVTSSFVRGVDALMAAGIPVHCLVAPEHGYWGAAQAGLGGEETRDERTGLATHSSYQVHGEALQHLLRDTGVDAVLVDLQDIGVRFYTYLWSLFDVMQACSRIGLPVIVLDRPAPLPATATGPGLDPSCASFVGRVNIPLRHGARLGELADHFARDVLEDPIDLRVIEAPGADGGSPWIAPSPNMPAPTTVALYPGTCLVEGTSWSEGRGSTQPFELLGAPWAGPEFADGLRMADLPGIGVREAVFQATHGVFAQQTVTGAQLHLLDDPAVLAADVDRFDPVRLGIEILRIMHRLHPRSGADPFWRRNHPGSPPFIDLLWGSSALREGIDDGAGDEEILAASPEPAFTPADVAAT